MPRPFLVHHTVSLFDDALDKLKQMMTRRWVNEEVRALLPDDLLGVIDNIELPLEDRKENLNEISDDLNEKYVVVMDLLPLVIPLEILPVADVKDDNVVSASSSTSEEEKKERKVQQRRKKKIIKRTKKAVVENEQKKDTKKTAPKKKRKTTPVAVPPAPPRQPSVSASGRVRRATAPRPGFFEENRGFIRH
jgi:hypothetical protein